MGQIKIRHQHCALFRFLLYSRRCKDKKFSLSSEENFIILFISQCKKKIRKIFFLQTGSRLDTR